MSGWRPKERVWFGQVLHNRIALQEDVDAESGASGVQARERITGADP